MRELDDDNAARELQATKRTIHDRGIMSYTATLSARIALLLCRTTVSQPSKEGRQYPATVQSTGRLLTSWGVEHYYYRLLQTDYRLLQTTTDYYYTRQPDDRPPLPPRVRFVSRFAYYYYRLQTTHDNRSTDPPFRQGSVSWHRLAGGRDPPRTPPRLVQELRKSQRYGYASELLLS